MSSMLPVLSGTIIELQQGIAASRSAVSSLRILGLIGSDETIKGLIGIGFGRRSVDGWVVKS